MDIAGYIIKFLIKNRYCSLPGLGSFDLVKHPARVTEDKQEILPPTYEVKFSPIGSIDDSFSSFMANHENVSISNASNHLKEFCIKVKEELQHKGEFNLPNFGTLYMHNSIVDFKSGNELDMGLFAQALPTLEFKVSDHSGKKLDFSYPAAHRGYRRKKIALGKYLVPAIVGLLLCFGIYFAWKYISANKNEDQPAQTNEVSSLSTDSASAKKGTVGVDSNSSSPVQVPGALPLYKVAVYESNVEASASSKAVKWKKFGHLTEVQSNNGNYIVTILASHPLNDTTMLVDSLRRFFNAKGPVYILK